MRPTDMILMLAWAGLIGLLAVGGLIVAAFVIGGLW